MNNNNELYIDLIKKVLIDYHRIGIHEYRPYRPKKGTLDIFVYNLFRKRLKIKTYE